MQSIEQLKNFLITEPVLHIYIRGAPTELHTDASKDGYGAVSLAEGMGLTSAEWRELRESVTLSDDEMEALDAHFKDS